jgi:hypothetical protein
MKNPDNINALFKRKIENEVMPYGVTAQSGYQLVSADA